MSEMSAVDVARFAFLKRDARFVLTKAAVAYVLLSAVIASIALAVSWPSIHTLAAWYFETIGTVTGGGEPSLPPTETVMAIAPVGFVAGMVAWVVLAAFEAAVLRWLVRGEHGGGVLGLTAGADTWRVFGLYWVWLGFALLATCAVVLFYVALRFLTGLHDALQIVGMIVGVLAPLGLAAAAIFFAVRLSPAAAYAVRERKFSVFGVWPVTRGKFWNLLGGFVIVIVAYLVVETILGGVLGMPLNQAIQSTMVEIINGASGAAAVARLQTTLLTPLNIALLAVYTVAMRVLAIVVVIAWYGVNASSVRAEAPAQA